MTQYKQKIDEAIRIFGKGIVYEVTELVDVSDPDSMYAQFDDMGWYEHAECVSYLYFEH